MELSALPLPLPPSDHRLSLPLSHAFSSFLLLLLLLPPFKTLLRLPTLNTKRKLYCSRNETFYPTSLCNLHLIFCLFFAPKQTRKQRKRDSQNFFRIKRFTSLRANIGTTAEKNSKDASSILSPPQQQTYKQDYRVVKWANGAKTSVVDVRRLRLRRRHP